MTSKFTESLERWGAYLDGKITYADAQDDNLPVARFRLPPAGPAQPILWTCDHPAVSHPADPVITANRAIAAYKVNDATEHAELSRYVTVGLNAGMAQEQASSWALEVFWNSENRKAPLACEVIPPENPRFRRICNAAVAVVAAGAFASSGGLEWLVWILLHWRVW